MTEPSQINTGANTGAQSARVADATRTARAAVDQARESTRVALGSRVEVQVKAVQRSGEMEVRLRTQGEGGQWSQNMRVGVTDSLRPALLDALRSLAASQGRGATLNAEVTSLTPRIMLRLLLPSADGAPGTKAWFNAQLRNHLPGAQRLATTFADWSRGLREAGSERPAQVQSAQNQALNQSVKQLLDRLASPRELTDPARLAESLRNSGVWLEATLARAGAAPASHQALDADLKAQLLRLAEQVRAQQAANPKPGQPKSAQQAETKAGQPSAGSPAQTKAGQAAAGSLAQTKAGQSATASLAQTKAGQLDTATLAQSRAGQPSNPTLAQSKADPQAPQQRAADMQMAGADRLAQLSTGLSREVDGVLKQLVTLQLQNAENGPDQQRWALELPFRTGAGLLTLDADIQREADQDRDQGENWSMQIRLDLPVLGPLLIRLSLRDSRLHGSLVAEQSASAELLRERLPELRAQLESRDLDIGSLHAREGNTQSKPPARAPLLREQA
ncbi:MULTISPECIES: flagellar hook-length control protein FliK [Thiorhodovibrio]|uniref:flagellar hook-length control protein FliK n=1 Tax=Thiorhodovibrio TaxID=61593 RepID=UPI0019124B17|nr:MULTISPECIES: flagellar hook-length control protein FliK [Thiorhodovibrio]MBK5971029.1 hypothetical protein [Thiorhodovibrio winogradskyi]WPL10604.1 Flagellar hook-length control protein FliK [Thiorhodovibrio litoralis]